MLSSFLASTSDNEDSLFCPGIGVERPTRCHTSDVYSAKNYGFANFIWGCLTTNGCIKYLDQGKERADIE